MRVYLYNYLLCNVTIIVRNMKRVVFTFVLYFQNGLCLLWPKGVVHFAINKKDYDLHSQDLIVSTMADIEREICVKFFNTPNNYNTSAGNRILYITNPDKRKNCPPDMYNFTASVVDMAIGYKCLDSKSIARIIVDMLRASIEQTVTTINSFDLIRRFQEQNEDPSRPFLINPTDRNFINAHYHSECGALSQKTPIDTRRSSGAVSLSSENAKYYEDKLWPLGILMYGINETLRNSEYHTQLKYAMTTIELASCVVFQEVRGDSVLRPNSFIWFDSEGNETPEFGFKEGKQDRLGLSDQFGTDLQFFVCEISSKLGGEQFSSKYHTIALQSMIVGAPGHTAHTINLLLRALGIPMVSNRPDRDNYVTVNWHNVQKGQEYYLEKYPVEGWIRDARVPYDFDSVTHAPANFVCRNCLQGETTVQPAQDHLWQRIMSMGHHTTPSASDKEILAILYSSPCRDRASTH